MWLRIYLICHCIVHDVFRALVPQPHQRIPISETNILYLLFPFLPLIYMGYLARRPDTFTLRLLLLPLVVAVAVGTYFRFMWTEPHHNIYNWGQALLAEAISAKAIDFAWRKEGMLKIDEVRPGVARKSDAVKANGDAHAKPVTSDPAVPALSWLYDALDVIISNRGLGWKFGVGIHVPRQERSLRRKSFLFATFISLVGNYLIFDLLESFIKLVPDVGTPHGGTIFRAELPFLFRYALSTAIHAATGSCILAAFKLVYDLITIFAVLLLGSSPSAWPPVMDHPWQSDSLHIFWSKRWHQILRETFFIFGGFFGGIVAGRIGMLFGTFIGSGLYHEFAAYALGRGFDTFVPLFFALQAPLLLCEKAWYKYTGYRVGGLYGRLWVYFCMLILGQPLSDSWHRRGLGGGLMIPLSLSPVRQFIIPSIRRSLNGRDTDILEFIVGTT
ncbi:hypothetical protein DEU56DRAFT_982418 [Suillus clintonianus]|uniref:uncharacterized protein n=1 Tax=Suillus clintonianus TaxID=1904413 RepID=UPI001B864B90|nr:uncharacterized protein DEU56DRAFT_982418 [Suillus clintonianus]KAG2129157.1 hypothetical protein DEU56DRAFT_982418 [Suillus clintonianus]